MICAICREQFKSYIDHIFSARHLQGVNTNIKIFIEIDEVIKDIEETQNFI